MEVLAGNDNYLYAWPAARRRWGRQRRDRVPGWPVSVTPPTPGYNENDLRRSLPRGPRPSTVGSRCWRPRARRTMLRGTTTRYCRLERPAAALNSRAGPARPPTPAQWSAVRVGRSRTTTIGPEVVARGEDGTVWAWAGDGTVRPGIPGGPSARTSPAGTRAVIATWTATAFKRHRDRRRERDRRHSTASASVKAAGPSR
jgi:hypothetical protein